MQTRKNRQAQGPRSAREGSARTRRPHLAARITRWLVPLSLALVLVAALAPIGQARSPEAEAQRTAAREERIAAGKAQREAERSRRAGERVPSERAMRSRSDERKNGIVVITCTQVSWSFREFPDLPHNTVTEKLTIDHVATSTAFTFDGSSGANVTPITAPPGSYIIDAEVKWRKASANGVSGAFDIHVKITCAAVPSMTVEKLQRIEGNTGEYTTAPLKAEVGETVDYEILADNTGNVPLTLAGLTDPLCDAGTISGGPAGGVLAVGASSAYVCKHQLTEADLAAGTPYSNTVTLTGTPPAGEGSPVTQTTNTVLVEVDPRATPPPAKAPETETTTTTTTTTTPAGSGGVLGSSTTAPPPGQTGVLAFSSATVPSLKGPQGCVRGSFHASIKATGVASVTFYLDGHKLRRLTAHSAHGARLTITVNPAKLSLGAHRLLAKITMVKASASAKAVQASRAITILRCHSSVVTPKFTG